MSKLAIPGAGAGYLLGAVLLLAAYAKAMDPHGFADQLHDMSVPANLAYPGALVVVAFEAGLGAALLGGSRHSLVLLASTATFVMFAFTTIPVAFATVQVWAGLLGWVRTDTMYGVPLATPSENA